MGNGKAEKGNLWCSIKSLKKALKNLRGFESLFLRLEIIKSHQNPINTMFIGFLHFFQYRTKSSNIK